MHEDVYTLFTHPSQHSRRLLSMGILGLGILFKSHLLHKKIEIGDKSSVSIFFYAEESLEPRVQGLLDINVSSVGSTGKRFTGPFS